MNRRAFFNWLAAAPVAIPTIAAAAIKAEPETVVCLPSALPGATMTLINTGHRPMKIIAPDRGWIVFRTGDVEGLRA